MLVEGRGLVAPAPVVIALDPGAIELIAQEARERIARRNYAGRSDLWGRGMISDAVFVGMVGERAFAKYATQRGFPLAPDVAFRKRGDGGIDFTLEGLRVQMKTRRSTTKSNLIRRRDHRGRLRALSCQAYVFASYDRAAQTVALLGWINVRHIADASVVRMGVGGQHENLSIDDRHLVPIARLFEDAAARRDIRRSA